MAVNPAPNKSVALIKNIGLAPIVYFDSAPVFGQGNGVVEITLAARALGLRGDNSVTVDMNAAAHLRCTLQAAQGLRDALDKAIAMATGATDAPAEGEKKH